MKNIAIYLAGTIQKSHENPNETFWMQEHLEAIQDSMGGFSVIFLNPALREDNLADQTSVFGRDMLQVFCADALFVDARHRRGLGVGAEMMWAKMNSIPVVTWAPADSHYNRSNATVLSVSLENWVHPFVESLSDKIAQSVEEGALWLKEYFEGAHELRTIKDREYIRSCIRHYSMKSYPQDKPMQECIGKSNHLRERMDRLER